jgi:hypothetical protein
MVHRAGAGPKPIPHKQLTADNLAEGIKICLKPESQSKAHELAAKIAKERGSDEGAQSFHQFLDVDTLRCSLAPSRAAVWSIKKTDVRLSAMAACTLANENLLDFKELKLFRGREYEVDDGPLDPITGGATSIIGTASTMMMGFADMPIETLKALKIHPDATKKKPKPAKGSDQAAASVDNASEKPSIDRTDSSNDASTPGQDLTPSTSRSGSTFNFQESLAKIQSPTGSRSGSLAPGQNEGRKPDDPKASKDPRKYMETAMGSAEGVQRIVGAGFKSPMDFTMNLSKGFRNAPKLYGDDSVRKPEKVTDFKSGIRAAGREFGFGMYDGITGLVTQPMKGAQKEGAAGFIKGIGKGIGGIALKPGAAVFGIPGYTMQGVYKEMQKQMGSSVQNYIIAARTAQGYEEWSGASNEERSDIVRRWHLLEQQLRKKRNADDVVKEIFEEARRKRMEGLPQGGRSAGAGSQAAGISTQQAPDPGALEAAIRESIRQTSRGNPEEDAAIERAIRVSMSELARNSGAARPQDDDDEALRKAMAASMQQGSQSGSQENERDEELERALANSLREQRRQYDNDDDDNDEDYQRALQESQRSASNAGEGSSSAPSYDQGHLGGVTKEQYEQSTAGKGEKSQQEKDEERIVMEYVKKQSMLEQQHQSGKKGEGSAGAGAGAGGKASHDDDDDDEELRRAMEESLKDQKGA